MLHKQVAAEEGLPYGDREKTFNSRLAQELGKWAEGAGVGDAYHRAVFQAYFANNSNISDVNTLLSLIERIGLSSIEAKLVLEKRTFKQVVDQDWLRCRQMGITAVPTFFMGNRILVGAQSYPILERFVTAAIH